ncbi:MAG: CDP-glycerol glycerophosphotransferase family protein [Micromonosporaceae bacterium]|jgi:hypothetical protein
MNRRAVAEAARAGASATSAVAALLALALLGGGWLWYALLTTTLLIAWAVERRPELGTQVPARVLLVAAITGHAVGAAGATWPAVSGALLGGVLLVEGPVRRLARPWYHCVNLPVRPGVAANLVVDGTAWLVNSAAVALVGLAAVLGVTGWSVLLPSAAAGGLTAWLAVDGVGRWRTGHRGELARLTRELTRYGPRFLLYFSAPPGSEYQARMWLPQLARLEEPFIVVLAERHNLGPIAASTAAPVVVYETFEALDAVMVPSLRAAFYVNNGMKNAHCVRYTRLTHVQLYHGDSDKAVTASPLNAMFDRVFVAGQAAIDRFAAHGVDIPREKLRIVGRPQVAALRVATGHIGAVPDKVVLYAPTWPGAYADSNHCSLPVAESIIEGLLERGVTVILRAHPYAARDRRCADHLRRAARRLAEDRARTGRAHLWGAAATTDLTLFECMNLSHAMICDVSSVASDYLYTGKPMAITDMTGAGSAFVTAFPVARAAYVLDAHATNLAAVLDDLLERDPLADVRRELRTYYLGDAPPDRYADTFLAEARRCLADGPAGAGGPRPRPSPEEVAA